jgi:hypothetical protein
MDTPTPTGTSALTVDRSGRSRDSTVPFVRMLNGVPLSASARMMPGMSR